MSAETTESPIAGVLTVTNTDITSLSGDIDRHLRHLNLIQNASAVLRLFSRCSDETGGYIKLRPEYHFIPAIVGSQRTAVPLYEVVEAIEGAVDYRAVINELPELTWAQVAGALSFLRRLVQTNPQNIDIDMLEDEAVTSDPAFLDELRTALADQEVTRVLNRD